MLERRAVLLVNLGSPAAPTTAAVRTYLREFLSDPRVIDLPRWQWLPILYSVVLTRRPPRVAKAYQSIWTDDGAPLLCITQAQVEALQKRFGDTILIDFAMRYGEPSVASRLRYLKAQGVTQLMVIPMYPQYSDATTASIFDAVAQALQKERGIPGIDFVRDWHQHPLYIKALSASIERYLATHDMPDLFLFSYHGIPQRYADEGDPYYAQCMRTSALVGARLGLTERIKTVFQSRFGKEEWLKPYADVTIEALPQQGIKNIAVLCPAFSADCLETLEEMAVENRHVFMEAGGERYDYIPALNDDAEHIDLLASLIEPYV